MKFEHLALIGAGIMLLPRLVKANTPIAPVTDNTQNVVAPAPSPSPEYTLDYVTSQWESARRELTDARHYTDIERGFASIQEKVAGYTRSGYNPPQEYLDKYNQYETMIDALKEQRYELAQDVQYWYKQRQVLL